MAFDRLLAALPFGFFKRPSPRAARRPAKILPIIAGIPGSDVWFLRFAVAFLAHLGKGGHVTDRLREKVVGKSTGPDFNFDHLRGGPLLWAPNLVASGHLFIGHTVCPGFGKIAAQHPWWQDTRFTVPGFDYFHEGLDYTQVPVDMAPHAYVTVPVSSVEDAAWTQPAQRAALVYPDPLEQAVFYFNYCRNLLAPAYNTLQGKRLAEWDFREYLFSHALPSYAKLFMSYQAMMIAAPRSVTVVPDWHLHARPAETLAAILSHVTGKASKWPMIEEAVDLARREHLKAVEIEFGRSMDRARRRRNRPGSASTQEFDREALEPSLRQEAVDFLASLGIDPGHFSLPPGAVPLRCGG